MTECLQNSYLQRYQQRQQSKQTRSVHKSTPKTPLNQLESLEPHTIASVVAKLEQRVDGIDVKMTSLVNVVKLLQRYSQTKDDQYEKQKQNELYRKVSGSECGHQCSQFEIKLKQFQVMSKQFKEQLKTVEKIKSNLIISEIDSNKHSGRMDIQQLEDIQDRLREEINKKMQLCVKLINNNTGQNDKGLTDKVNELSFNFNQLENECKRNRMVMEKEIDALTSMVKDNSTALPNNHSRVTERETHSRSPNRVNPTHNKSKNSRSDKSLSKGKQNKSAILMNIPKEHSKVREEEMREALRKKREHRQRLKVRNY